MSNIFVNCCTNDSSSRLCALWHSVCTLFAWENTRIREQSFAEQPTTAAWFEKVQRAKKRQNIFKSSFEIYFSFCVENGLFSALCHLSSHENGAKVQNRVGFGAFWAQNRKKSQKHRMNIICGSEKKCGTEFEKANWASKRRVAFRLLYVIAASLPVLKPAEFAVFCDRGFGFRNGIGERLLQKAVAFGVFCVPKSLWARWQRVVFWVDWYILVSVLQ